MDYVMILIVGLPHKGVLTMERSVAIKKLSKMLGKSLGYRVDPNAPTPEERAEARLRSPALAGAKKQAEEAMEARRKEVLAADREYQELVAACRTAREQASKASSMTHHFKYTVGTSNGLWFSVKAQGDSWEDVIEKLTSSSA